MAGIVLRTTKRRGVVDVYNTVTLINDIYTGRNRELNTRIGFQSPSGRLKNQMEVDDGPPSR
ncbi:MAG: hypothetical protein AB1665_09090 [Candidatus Thermoplasmatota archaeon]